MILDVPRMYADWCQDPTHGVNALVPQVPRDVGDALPADLALIVAEADNGDVARGELPSTRPCLTVACDVVADLDGQVQTITADGKVKLRFRIGLDEADTAAAVTALGLYLRALQWSIRRFTDGRLNVGSVGRTRNGIYVESLLDMAAQVAWAMTQQNTKVVTGYVIATVQARDLTPTGP